MRQIRKYFSSRRTVHHRPVTDWLGLSGRQKRPDFRLDLIAIVDLLVIALLVSLLFTRFVVFPGVRVDLPSTSFRMYHTSAKVSVLTIENEGMLFYQGRVYEISALERAFSDYIKLHPAGTAVLLIKPQAGMQLDRFLHLCEIAQLAGFGQVQIAGQKNSKVTDLENNSLQFE
ncbi:MAG: hypothetical protein CL815_07715 [Coraliomargarita sp.]|nr:hypothetical protein [Coraliomargarita sp.]